MRHFPPFSCDFRELSVGFSLTFGSFMLVWTLSSRAADSVKIDPVTLDFCRFVHVKRIAGGAIVDEPKPQQVQFQPFPSLFRTFDHLSVLHRLSGRVSIASLLPHFCLTFRRAGHSFRCACHARTVRRQGAPVATGWGGLGCGFIDGVVARKNVVSTPNSHNEFTRTSTSVCRRL